MARLRWGIRTLLNRLGRNDSTISRTELGLSSKRQWTVFTLTGATLGSIIGVLVFSTAAYHSSLAAGTEGWHRFLVDYLALWGLIVGPVSPLFPVSFLRDKYFRRHGPGDVLFIRVGMVITLSIPLVLGYLGGFELFTVGGTRETSSFIVVLNGVFGCMLGAPLTAHVIGYFNPHIDSERNSQMLSYPGVN
jgi:hypothetical protein